MASQLPSGAQLALFPMWECTVAAGFKNPAYRFDPAHPFPHYGADFDSLGAEGFDVLASGDGTVLGVEFCSGNSLGGVVVIEYPRVYLPASGRVRDLVFRYMHLSRISVAKGDAVSAYSVIGRVSGSHKWWNHVHVEVDTDTLHPFHTPQVAENGSALLSARGASDSTMLDPMDVLAVGERQTAVVHPRAQYVSAKDLPKFHARAFAPAPSGAARPPQTLILPVNRMYVTCGYKNPLYPKTEFNGRYLGEHYGMDFGGSATVYASGTGTVLLSGWDSCFGNAVAVRYERVLNHRTGGVLDCVFRYFHLADRGVAEGQPVTKDTVLGVMGRTGTYANGVHVHLEADADAVHYAHTPTLTGPTTLFRAGLRGGRDTTFSPAEVLHVKTSAPDFQTASRTDDGYTAAADLDMPNIQ